MPKPLFCVDDPIELLALWRLVAEAKFQPHPDDTDLWGSPYVHALARRIADAQLEYARNHETPDKVERHLSWRASLKNNVVLPVVKSQLKKDTQKPEWKRKSHTQKLSYVQGCVAPFEVDSEFLEELIRDAEA